MDPPIHPTELPDIINSQRKAIRLCLEDNELLRWRLEELKSTTGWLKEAYDQGLFEK